MQVGAAVASKMLEGGGDGSKTKKSNPSELNPLGNLPAKASRMWEKVYESALDRGADKGAAAAQAWCAVKRYYHKKGNRWLKRKKPLGRDESPPGCTPYAANPVDDGPVMAVLMLMETLRMGYDVYREAHWRVQGDAAYGQHLLFERLYTEIDTQVDLFAELATGTFGPEIFSLDSELREVRAEYVSELSNLPPLEAGLNVVSQVEEALENAHDQLDRSGWITPGWDNALGGLSQMMMQHKYLLDQSRKQTRSLKHKLLK